MNRFMPRRSLKCFGYILTLLSFIYCSVALAQNEPAASSQDFAKSFKNSQQEKLEQMKKDFAQKVKQNEEALRQSGSSSGSAPQGPPPAPPGGTTGPMGATPAGPPGSTSPVLPGGTTNVPGTRPPAAPNPNIYMAPPPPPPAPQTHTITPPTAAGSSQLPPANTNIYQ